MRVLNKLWRGCQAKMRYGSRAAAREEADRLLKANRVKGGSLHVYGCDFCGGFHLGHAKYGVGRRLAKGRKS